MTKPKLFNYIFSKQAESSRDESNHLLMTLQITNPPIMGQIVARFFIDN